MKHSHDTFTSDNSINKKRDYDSYLEYEDRVKTKIKQETNNLLTNLVGTDIDKTLVLNEENLEVSYDNLSELEKKTLYDLYNKRYSSENSEYRPLRSGEEFNPGLISLYLDKDDNILFDSSKDTPREIIHKKIDM
ncbi:MAG: hypothetical protein ACRCZI_04365 [Cetobacterium sp.]